VIYLNESQLETAAIDYFHEPGYEYAHGPEIPPDSKSPEREDYSQVVLVGRF